MNKPTNNKSGVWTEARVEQLRLLWAEGLSGSQISKRLGGVISRNGVIGKVHRLGLPARMTQFQTKRIYAVGSMRTPVLKVPPPPPVPFLCAPEVFAEGRTCRFIQGDPCEPGWQMCGQPGYPWCGYHRSICWDKPRTVAVKKEHAERQNEVRKADGTYGGWV